MVSLPIKMLLNKYIFYLFIFMLGEVNSEEDSNSVHSIQYTEDNFSSEVLKSNHFVMFYAPWCGYCQMLKPTWEQLAELSNKEENIKIAKVDCTTDNNLCAEHDITGYPTLKFFKAGETTGTKFKGTRDLPSLTSFLNEKLGITLGTQSKDTTQLPVEAENGILELTEDTFDKHISNGHHFVKFYAPWCGHCQKLSPVWDELANDLSNNNGVSISKIDCTEHRGICGQFDIKGYPSLLWIEDGKKIDKYAGPRTHEELKSYVLKMLGKGNDQVNIKNDNTDSVINAVLNLTGENFKHGIESGISFVKFFAPWCGHCKRLAPIWKDLGKKFITNDNVNIIKVDCTLDTSKELCNEQEIDGFPTLCLYRDGAKVSEYNGARNLDDLYEFVMNYVQPHDEL